MSRVVNRLANMNKTTRSSVFTYALVVGAFVILQLLRMTTGLGSVLEGQLIPICAYVTMALALNLVVGVSGELSLGHAGFMSIGAFLGCAAANGLAELIPFTPVRLGVAMVIGAALAGFFGFLIGIPVLRLNGDYLAIVTLAFGEIIKNIMNAVYLGVDDSGLQVEALPTAPIKAYHKPAKNIAAFDITWALGQVSGEDSIEDTYNAVVIAAEDDGKAYIGAQASNAASIKRYGFMQHIETVTENPGTAVLGQMVKNLLKNADKVGQTRSISEIWGCDEVKSGVVLRFNSPAFGIKGNFRITRVVHHYGGAGHTMALEITALEQVRAAAEGKTDAAAIKAASTDKVQVFGLPDLSGGSDGGSGGTIVKALFTAYYPANNALEGGYLDAQGNRLDPSKKTCAAPPSVPFGTKITVRDTGTSLDGMTYTVNDRGGAIQIVNGVYHFDLLMSSNAECNRWGRKNGSAIIGGSGGGSGSAVSFINTALGEVGYKESGKDINKYGQWAGHNGVAWCVYFVCWCAAKSGAPIPTTYGYVGDMSSYFKARGKYKSAGSYKPKAGDLMIQGDRHIGIVISAGASSCETVEGNYSNSVKRVTRSYAEISGFCTPWG